MLHTRYGPQGRINELTSYNQSYFGFGTVAPLAIAANPHSIGSTGQARGSSKLDR